MIERERLFKNFDEQREVMEDRINHGIETYRKGYARLNFVDENGKPLKGAKVSIKQLSHDFKFGCNIFKYKCFPTDEENALYEEKFAKLFNLAVAPLYWDDFEPEEGKMRFDKDSPFIDRRPAPELILEFCRERGIEVKGHPLFWLYMVPPWLPNDFEKVKPYLTRRLKKIAQRYDGVFRSFDCVNEVLSVPDTTHVSTGEVEYWNLTNFKGNYAQWVFKQADRFFAESKLNLNERPLPWRDFRKELSPYYLLIENLLNKGCRIEQIGLQYHIFKEPAKLYEVAAFEYNPLHLYRVLDCYGQFQIPISISEITVPGYGTNGEEIQAQTLRNLYRIWFSHKDVEEIVYWNFGDNCAIPSEIRHRGGLLHQDFSEKLSYQVLDDLINHQWRTELEKECEEDFLYFKGFYGEYQLTVFLGEQEITRKIQLSRDGYNEFTIEL